MDREGFRQMLRERQVPEDQIEGQIALAERFEGHTSEPSTPDDVRAFVTTLVEEELNTWDNLAALARYGRFTKNDPVYVAALELIDGSEVLDKICAVSTGSHGGHQDVPTEPVIIESVEVVEE